MAEKTSQGLNLYDYMTDRNRDIYDGTFGKTDGTNPSSMEVINNFMENKLTLNGEKSKQNFNFIENKLASGTDYYVKNLNKSISTGIIESDYFSFSGVVSLNENRSTTTYIVGNHTSTANSMSGFTVGVAPPNNVVSLFVTLSQNERFIISDIGLRMVIGDNRLSITRDGTTFTIIINGNRYVYTAPTYVKGTKSVIIGDFSTTGKDLECRITGFTTFKQLSQQEITHNLSVINNSQSINQLQVTDSTNKSSILSLGTDGNHVEMSSGRTLEEEYMGVLEGMSQEYTSTGASITVNDGLNARLVGAEITGQTIKSYAGLGTANTLLNSTTKTVSLVGNAEFLDKTKAYKIKSKYVSATNAVMTATITFADATTTTLALGTRTASGVYEVEILANTYAQNYKITSINITNTTVDINANCTIYQLSVIDSANTTYVAVPWGFGLSSTSATISNNGISYPLYASLTDKASQKQISLGGVGGVNDKLTLNSDGSLNVDVNNISLSIDTQKITLISESSTTIAVGLGISGVKYSYSKPTVSSNILPSESVYSSTSIGGNPWGQSSNPSTKEYIVVWDDNKLYSIFFKSKVGNTLNDVKLYLTNNPMQVLYQLATPTTYTVDKAVNEPVLTNQSNVLSAGEAVSASSFAVKLPTTSSIKKQYAQTLLNNYTGTASANLLKDGRVQIDMTVTIPTTFNQTVFSLPTELRPKVARKVMGFNGNNPVTLLVGTDGTVKIPTTITGVIELDGTYVL